MGRNVTELMLAILIKLKKNTTELKHCLERKTELSESLEQLS